MIFQNYFKTSLFKIPSKKKKGKRKFPQRQMYLEFRNFSNFSKVNGIYCILNNVL